MLRKRLALILACALAFSGCGSSDETNFSGTWDGSFNSLDNTCPFTVNQSLGDLFPMVVSEDAAGVFTIRANNGDIAVGGQGEGETISFSADSAKFGSFGSSAPFVCTTSPFMVSFLEQEDNSAVVNVYVTFRDCATPDGSQTSSSCSILYSGEAFKR